MQIHSALDCCYMTTAPNRGFTRLLNLAEQSANSIDSVIGRHFRQSTEIPPPTGTSLLLQRTSAPFLQALWKTWFGGRIPSSGQGDGATPLLLLRSGANSYLQR